MYKLNGSYFFSLYEILKAININTYGYKIENFLNELYHVTKVNFIRNENGGNVNFSIASLVNNFTSENRVSEHRALLDRYHVSLDFLKQNVHLFNKEYSIYAVIIYLMDKEVDNSDLIVKKKEIYSLLNGSDSIHNSEGLVLLNRTMKELWSTYDPEQISTAPSKKEVIDYILSEGGSSNLAKAIDLILRPNNVKKRGRPLKS
ncbi:hypothetical protein C5E04_08845 [Pectobacterium parmentieri]|uniref:hypothetical protein n=1 Tax=Pectobacterium parmentieri TaxID=1905730 RepID=UPI000EB11EBB|nr:hypothetical protein [Pectobacterium parmentieri]RKO79452.1 hypothetical protein C5E04_08845 [Pectobacterium parmentieri]